MYHIKDKERTVGIRKKTICPKNFPKAQNEKQTQLLLKLLRGCYQIYGD